MLKQIILISLVANSISLKMSCEKHRLILVAILIIFVSFSNSNRCYKVYICCIKIDTECEKYCEPFEECPDILLVENTTNNDSIDLINKEETHKGNDTQALNVKSCRKGFRIVNGICKRVF